jgi:tetratricopeptide (TPR) repeat protein
VGKSRLLYEFRKVVANEDVTFLEGKCLSYSRGVAYHPVIDILKANFDIQEDDGGSEIREKVKRVLKMLGVDEASTLPYLLELLSVKDSGIEKIAISPETRKERIIEALNTIVLKGSAVRPLIMAIEDLHWIDKSSEERFRSLLDSIPGARILVIFTYRPEFVHTWGGRSYHSQVTLNRLSNRESLSMVSYLLGTEDIESDLEEFILEKTEGVPFFIEEFIKSLKNLKIIEKKNKRYHLAKGIKDVTIPATIQDVIMARVDSLPEKTKSLLQTVSAIGRDFSYELVKRVTVIAQEELLSCLSVLKDSELLYERGVYPQSSYIFKHMFTQEVVYNSLLVKKRRQIHEKIASAIETIYADRLEEHCDLLAYHYSRSSNTDKAVEYLDKANKKAISVNAVEEAKDYFDKAMELLDTMPDTEKNCQRRISLLINQWAVFLLLLKFPEYYDLLTRYEPIAKELGYPELLGPFYARLGDCEYSFGYFDRAIQTLTKAAQLAEACGDVEEEGHAHWFLIWCHLDRGNYDRVFAFKEDLVRKMEQRFNYRWYVYTLSGASRACSHLGRWDDAVKESQKALRVAEEFSDDSMISFAAFNLSIAYTWKGDLARAVEYGELAVQKAQTPFDKAFGQRSLAWAWCRAEELDRGIKLLHDVLSICRAGHFTASEFPLMCYLGEGYWLAGEYDKAKQTLEEGLEIAEHCGARYYFGWAHRLLGEIALKTNPVQAAAHFEKSMAVLQEIEADNELALAYEGYGRVHKEQGQIAQARQYLTKALELFERLGTLIEVEKVKEELAGLPEG